jgi:hypothetical protein
MPHFHLSEAVHTQAHHNRPLHKATHNRSSITITVVVFTMRIARGAAENADGLASRGRTVTIQYTNILYSAYDRPCNLAGEIDDNDSGESQQPCNVTNYRCPNTDNATKYQVLYEYDVHHNPNSSVEDVLAYLEQVMLDYVASALGVDDCMSRRRMRNLRKNDNQEQQAAAKYVGVDLRPEDHVSVAPCRSEPDSPNIACLPIEGGMTVFLDETQVKSTARLSDEDAHDDGVYQFVTGHVKQGMQKDLFVVRNIINKVVFVNNRTILTKFPEQTIETPVEQPLYQASGSTHNQLPGFATGLISAGVIASILLVSLLIYRKRNKLGAMEKVGSGDSDEFDIIAIHGLSPPATPNHKPSVVTDLHHYQSDTLPSFSFPMDKSSWIEPLPSQLEPSLRNFESIDSYLQTNQSMNTVTPSRTWGPDDTSYAYSLDGQRMITPLHSLCSDGDSLRLTDDARSESATENESGRDEHSAISQDSACSDSSEASSEREI